MTQHKQTKLLVLLAAVALLACAAYADSNTLQVTFDVYSDSSINSTINLVANQSSTVNVSTDDVSATVALKTTGNITNGSLSVYTSEDNPRTSSGISSTLSSLSKFVDIRPSAGINSSLSSAQIRIYYSSSDLSLDYSDFTESSLAAYFWNESQSSWTLEGVQGVDETNNYVWINTTHFSIFGVFGAVVARGGVGVNARGAGSTASANGYTITCNEKWSCGQWSACSASGVQTRKCSESNDCRTTNSKPAEQQSCTPPASCSDGIKNQGEQGVDCGGPCAACQQPAPVTQPVAKQQEQQEAKKVPLSTSLIVLGAVTLLIIIIFCAMGKKTRHR
jgi:hypothetical protein